MQTVLVAGGAGFIGSHLCKSLLDDNYKVICIDNLITGEIKNLRDLEKNKNFRFINQDLIQLKNLSINKIDYIFHLASPASPSQKSPRSYIKFPVETLLVNSQGTYNLLELGRKHRACFLFASSSEVYGDPTVSPQDETYFGNVNPNGVRSVYDEGKRYGEAVTMAYVRKYNLDARIVRIFNTYGPKMRPDDGRVVSNFINQALKGDEITVYGDGTQTRSICFVDDMIKGLKIVMFSDKSRGEVINLGNPDERTILDLAHLIKKMTNSNSEITFEELPEDDPKTRKPDITKARKLLDWKPEVSIENGLEKTIEYFKRP
ncbi:MAG: SDR family oxidoreductase [Candidatus Levybacteria bacterium]|nr:SDR family oxidoreductase [Candidatus Levybacteria bacterium]